MNHLGNTNKMVSDTPRTDARRGFHGWYTAVDAEFSEKLERELNESNQRIKRLEKENNELRAEEARLLNINGELERRIKQLEEQLMDAKNKHAVLVADVVLNEDRAERIKRLEEENDAMRADLLLWNEKEAKP